MKVLSSFIKFMQIGVVALLVCNSSGNLWAQAERSGEPTQLDRIKLFINYSPLQTDVDIDKPTEEELASCRLEKAENPPGYIVKDTAGRILRKFLDTSGNKKLDHLSYYKNGIEVYREIDSSGNGKPQEFRWLGSGGTRWGFDRDGDNKIDEWKRIGAEEVVHEAFEAIRTKDAKRFEALLLTTDEFKALKLGETLGTEVETRWQKAKKDFLAFCISQGDIDSNAEFVNATNGIPSLVAAETYGNETDLLFYDHASAVYQNSKKDYGNLAVGTVIHTGDGNWRLIELPEVASPGSPIANGNVFFPSAIPTSVAESVTDSTVSKELAEIHNQLDAIEANIKSASKPAEVAKLEEVKAGLLEKLISVAESGEQQMNTLMYAADSIASAYQEDRFPDGIKFLEGLTQRLRREKIDGLDYIKWRAVNGRFNYVNSKGSNEERDKAHERWLAELMEFQKEFPSSKNAAEALCYLGVHFDNEGKEKEAIEWYTLAAERFPDTPYGKRSKGALVRLDGLGEKLQFFGVDSKGSKFDLQDPKWREKVIVIHFWETWCPEGLEQVQRLVEKYKEDVVFVGCNIESTTDKFEDFMKKKPEYAGWLQLHAPGSIESSPLAQQLGVPSLPLVMIVSKKGELVEPMVVFADLDRQIERQRRK